MLGVKLAVLILVLALSAFSQPIGPIVKPPCNAASVTNCTPQLDGTGRVAPSSVPAWSKYSLAKVAPNGTLVGGTYTSGITATGTVGQTCVINTFNGGGTSAAVTVALTGTNTIAGGTALVVTNVGSGYSSAPTSGTASNGTATCTGTATVSTTITGSCQHLAGCWSVNGGTGVQVAAGLTQDVTLFELPAKAQVTDWRIKSKTACTGTTTLNTGLGVTGNNVLFRAYTYDLKAAVSNTNLTTGPTASTGSLTAAAINVLASLISTVDNLDQTANGCAVDFWLLYAVAE